MIESLQRDTEEDSVECGEEIDDCKEGTEAELSEEAHVIDSNLELIGEAEDAKLDMLAGDKENCDVNSGGLDKDTEGIMISLNDSKSPEKPKKTSTSAEISPNKSIDKPGAAKSKIAKSKLSDNKELKAISVADEAKRTYKRKVADDTVTASLDAGARTRSKTRKLVQDDDNCA